MSKHCDQCGAELLPDARFCGKCGNKVYVEPSANTPVGTSAGQPTGQSVGVPSDKPPKQFASLMEYIWMAIGISALSGLICFFDVREYYAAGRFGLFFIEGGSGVLSIWLALAILKRKNWARVTFIALTLFEVVLRCKSFSTSGNGFCLFLDCWALVIALCCVVLLLKNKISRCFVKSEDGVKRAAIFWGVYVAFITMSIFYMAYYQSANELEYVNNCAEAAANGSKDAYQELISYGESHANVSKGDIDEFVNSKKNGGHDSNWRYSGRPSPGAIYGIAKGSAALLMKIKGAAKVIAVVGALLCGIGAWLKKTFINGNDSK